MLFLTKRKDGGSDSPVDAYFLIEIKSLFSVAILKFNKGGREAFHTHAFNAYTWFLKGDLEEEDVLGSKYQYKRSLLPKYTTIEKNHRVLAKEDSYCLTVRGSWVNIWTEYRKDDNTSTLFTLGRKVLGTWKGV
tara:strand:- start:5 stop:406 length:402 start_codon:yes stop_codon:yes gene_type:complete